VHLLRILKHLSGEAGASVLLSADDDASAMTIVNESVQKRHSYQIKLFSMDESAEYGSPEIEYDVVIKMSFAEFQRICKCFGAFGDTLKIEASNAGVVFSQESDVGMCEVALMNEKSGEDKENGRGFEMEIKKDVSIRLTSKYFTVFGRSGISSDVIVRLSSGMPALLSFPMNKVGYLNFFIAPKNDE
jgi:proliferating cell nuclear antigen PCNA